MKRLSIGKQANFSDLEGQILIKILRNEEHDNTVLYFVTDQKTYRMMHWQSCCEGVYLEEIHGDPQDLYLCKIIKASEDYSDLTEEPADSLKQNTFYHLQTQQSAITLRWYGSSNGYYSIDVNFEEVDVQEADGELLTFGF